MTRRDSRRRLSDDANLGHSRREVLDEFEQRLLGEGSGG